MQLQVHATTIFKALADETRLQILRYLHRAKTERSCQDISSHFPLSQPALSHHFAKLQDANLLKVRKNGVMHFYRINTVALRLAGINLNKIFER